VNPLSYGSLRSNLLLRPVELSLVDPHAVQDDRELGRDGDCGLQRPFRLASLIPQAFNAARRGKSWRGDGQSFRSG
jgi:hypothetical protein